MSELKRSTNNPCDVCKKEECDDCVLKTFPRHNICGNRDCFLNYEGSCVLTLYENCGAWEG